MVRPPYSGEKRTLVLAFDIGTTFSGVSYVLLDPGQIPEINSVTRCALPLTSTTPVGSILRLFPQVPRSDPEQFQNSFDRLVRCKRESSLFWSRGFSTRDS